MKWELGQIETAGIIRYGIIKIRSEECEDYLTCDGEYVQYVSEDFANRVCNELNSIKFRRFIISREKLKRVELKV